MPFIENVIFSNFAFYYLKWSCFSTNKQICSCGTQKDKYLEIDNKLRNKICSWYCRTYHNTYKIVHYLINTYNIQIWFLWNKMNSSSSFILLLRYIHQYIKRTPSMLIWSLRRWYHIYVYCITTKYYEYHTSSYHICFSLHINFLINVSSFT